MMYEDIFDLFGYSEFSPEVALLLPRLHIPLDRPERSVCWRIFESGKWNLTLTFIGKNNYKNDYGVPAKEYTEGYDETVLEEVSFGGASGKRAAYPYPLPYGLSFGDDTELVRQKIGDKKARCNQVSYGSSIIFIAGGHQYVAAFDHGQKLIWLRVKQVGKSIKAKKALEASLRQQNKNLNDSGIEELNRLKHESPVLSWTQRMEEGDEAFSREGIEATRDLLVKFVESLVVAATSRKANAVYSAIKKLIKAINKINDKYEGFIETTEREVLAAYIHKCVRLTGFVFDDSVDLTEEWRDW